MAAVALLYTFMSRRRFTADESPHVPVKRFIGFRQTRTCELSELGDSVVGVHGAIPPVRMLYVR